jgi:GT2 family glycosyltransferase
MGSGVVPVSVVIPTYRRPDMLERAIRSVLCQTFAPQEIVVVDDASGDDSGARASALGARVVTNRENLGEGGARNSGLEAAQNQWVALLDSDDEWLPKHLEALWPARNGHVLVGTAALGCGPNAEDHRIYGWSGRRIRILRGPGDLLAPENKLTPSSVLVRRDAVLAAGGFRRNMPRAADLDLWVRLLESGSGLAIPEVTTLYHIHPGQVSTDSALMWEAHRDVLAAYAGRPWHTPRLTGRHSGALAWDQTRAEFGEGKSALAALARLLPHLARPSEIQGLLELLIGRFRGRRRASRLSLKGLPTVAVLPGSPAPDSKIAAELVDMRGWRSAAALFALLRHPTEYAVANDRLTELVVRGLGIKPFLRGPAE